MLTLQCCLQEFPIKVALSPNFTLIILFSTFLINTRLVAFNVSAKKIFNNDKVNKIM